MAHQVADLDLFLSIGRKFWPVARDRRIEIQFAAIGNQERSQRRHGFGCGIYVDDRVLLPRARAGLIGKATPKIDYGLAIQRRAEGRTHICTAGKVLRKYLAHRRVAIIGKPLH